MDKTFNAAAAEPRLYAKWEAEGCFKAGANASRDETFTIVIPPPNVTGSLHIGHALNNTLQDILVRWHRMRGFDTLWQPGTDHAGIATQMVVERELAANGEPGRKDMTREAFVDRVWQQKERSEGTILGQLKRLGASCDWSRTEFTMSPNLSTAVLKVFVDLFNEGLIYKDKRLVNWDPKFETAISDLEVEPTEVDGHMWHFKYPLADGETYEYIEKDEDGAVTLRETRDYISIATTRPETMLGDGAVAVNPRDERYQPIIGKMVHLPLCDRLIPIIADEYPDPDFGSGAVKITGAHDFNDYEVAKRNDIPLYNLMTTRAAMRDDDAEDNLVPAKYRGMDRFDARKAVIEDITAAGLAVMIANPNYDVEAEEPGPAQMPYVESKKIMQPFGDRSKVVIEPYLTDQWFVDAKTLAGPALEAVKDGRTTFAPKNWEKTYFNWLEDIQPWCISRQLWWGHRIPVWYGPSKEKFPAVTGSQQRFVAASEEAALSAARDYYECDVEIVESFWVDGDTEKANSSVTWTNDGNGWEKVTIGRDPDVLDTWFSSALWPFSTLGWPNKTPELAKYYKTDVLITGNDIIFFWVARMMMQGLHFLGEVPFHTVYINSIVTDAKGKKMSKSVGNVIDPLDLIEQFGADATRYALASQEVQGKRQLRMSAQMVEGARNFGTKLWNAARFAEMNGVFESDQNTTKALPKDNQTHTVNKWIIGETARTAAVVDAALSEYKFNEAAGALYDHIWKVFCDWYVEFSKPLLSGDDAAAKAETQATMAWAFEQCLILLHPIMPFITEELWGSLLGHDRPIMLTDWPSLDLSLADAEADGEMAWVIRLIEEIRSVRSEMNVPAGAKTPLVLVGADADLQAMIARNSALIQKLARLDGLVHGEAPSGSVTIALDGATACLPLAGVIDLSTERARLNKSIAKLGKEADGLSRKLSNEGFLAKAPPEVVDEQRERLAVANAEVDKLRAALARLESMA